MNARVSNGSVRRGEFMREARETDRIASEIRARARARGKLVEPTSSSSPTKSEPSPRGGSTRTRERQASVLKFGCPSLIAAMHEGKVNVAQADQLARLPHAKQVEVLGKGERAIAGEVSRLRAIDAWERLRKRIAPVVSKFADSDLSSQRSRDAFVDAITSAVLRQTEVPT